MVNNRQSQIMDLLNKDGSVRIDDLVDLMDISVITVRRELKKMEDDGLVERFRGGAIMPKKNRFGYEPPLIKRQIENKEGKKAIGKIAAEMVNEGDVIVIDLGTTGIEIAKAIRTFNDITVFTGSLRVANILMNTNINVYLFGGLIQGKEECVGGTIARFVISKFCFDKFFLGASGISLDYGITDFGTDEIEIKNEIMKRSREVICVTDSSKFENNDFIKICEYTEIDKIITDSNLDSLVKQRYEKEVIPIIIAKHEK